RPHHPVAPCVAIARGVAEREPAGCALCMQGLHELEEPIGVLGHALETGGIDHALPIDERIAGATEWHADPALSIRPEVLLAHRVPAAVLRAEITANIGDIDEL